MRSGWSIAVWLPMIPWWCTRPSCTMDRTDEIWSFQLSIAGSRYSKAVLWAVRCSFRLSPSKYCWVINSLRCTKPALGGSASGSGIGTSHAVLYRLGVVWVPGEDSEFVLGPAVWAGGFPICPILGLGPRMGVLGLSISIGSTWAKPVSSV